MIPPEHRLVASIIRSYITPETTPPAAASAADWSGALDFMRAHGMVPLAARLRAHDMPAGLAEENARLTRAVHRRNALFLLELQRFVPALEAAGCSPLVLKGPALAQTLYPDPTDRWMADLDILIGHGHVERSCEVLGWLGFEPSKTKRHREFYDRHHFHRILNKRNGVTVELHWDLSRPTDFYRFDLDGLRERAREASLDGTCIRIPDDGDQLLHAASESISEGFCNPWRIVDGALILLAARFDGPRVAERAAAQGLGRALWILCGLIQQITGVSAPAAFGPDPAPGRLGRVCLRSLDLPTRCLESRTRRQDWKLRSLLRWACAPGFAGTCSEIARFVFPREQSLLDKGYRPGELPGAGSRVVGTLHNLWSLAKIVAYQGGRLVGNGLRRRQARHGK